jgi:hypothetical protein
MLILHTAYEMQVDPFEHKFLHSQCRDFPSKNNVARACRIVDCAIAEHAGDYMEPTHARWRHIT